MSVRSEEQPFLDVRDITRLVGPASFARGQEYASRGAVLDTTWDADSQILVGHVAGTSPLPYESRIRFRSSNPQDVVSSCTCPVGGNCKHVAATLIRRNLATLQDRLTETSRSTKSAPVPSEPPPITEGPSWKSAIAALTAAGVAKGTGKLRPLTPLGLLFELREIGSLRDRWRGESAKPVDVRTPQSADIRLGVRPVTLSPSGNWVRNVNWGNFAHQGGRLEVNPDHQSWLAQLAALHRSSRAYYVHSEPEWLYLDDLASPLLWTLFDTSDEVGISLITDKKGSLVGIGREATVALEVVSSNTDGAPADLHVSPAVRIDGAPHAIERTRLVGDHGIYTWDFDPAPRIALAPTAVPVTTEQRNLLANASTVVIPAADTEEFLSTFYPTLRRSVPVTSPDASVDLPQPVAPTLVLTATYAAGHKLRLDWGWDYAGTRAALAADATSAALRDPALERELLERVKAELPEVAVVPSMQLEGIDAAEFTAEQLPRIRSVDEVRVNVVGTPPDYRELVGAPSLAVSTVETDKRDWFDLGVNVKVDGKTIPFTPLFTALAKGANRLLLTDGSYLSLRQPVFDRLRELLAEAAELDEWESGLRISRYQASLWEDFEDLADSTEEAVAWRESVAGLLGLAGEESVAATPPPAGLATTLRPYQQEGFDWLVFLWRHSLGGVLADDMGLGKTLQTLALVAHAVEATPEQERRPFLVVAPTSVVSNWVAEARRFAPGLSVAGITETEKKSRIPIADAVRGADLIVTSYALFRLDFPSYQVLPWAGLILDEAQFVKNAESQAHENAVALPAPFKLAITGTPMENSLTDLWSLFKIVAPGLFPSARRFREEYVRPITAGGGADRLALLRRRIRPLMVRRTKELVASDLPPKQEQILSVELSPRHRKLYDTVLQRERQKLLGLLADMDRNRFIVFRSLTLLRMLSLDASLVDEKHAGIPSAKLDVLFEQLVDVLAEGHRALVFSQFTSFLGLARARFEKAGIPYEYLDGSTPRRGEVIEQWRNGSAPVFLISLKAGGFGLNLTEADYVFLLDPWWNPAAEEQAIDRTHRIGQTRSVNVYRMVAMGTIEEKVMALKKQKARLFDAVIEDDAKFSSALTAEDIRALL
ncbi:DEAD/DEAH box helicase [Naasia sp. SYSU D00948]|uniref:DEAD/DEAH box helicase n=1 Tax=Naasia sp. SYSU D00948 TaxID=2817379 RepID=UPI001B30C171|nr:DEAD/DEAH box helicase [Naasia sp. SYSU D00948]